MELLEALTTIREECKKHRNTCASCPLRQAGSVSKCGVANSDATPETWALDGDDDGVPSLFI